MHMPSFDQILARVVERKGYAVQGADHAGLLARKGDESLLVAWKTDGPVTSADALLFTTAMAQISARTGILVAPRGTDQAARDQLAAFKNVELWAESRLVVEVGEAYVKDALEGATAAPAAAAPATVPATAAAAPVAQQSNAVAIKQTSKFPSLLGKAMSLSTGDTRGTAYLMPSKPRAAPAPTAATAASAQPLRYAWGGIAGSEVDPGVAQVRNGRRPRTADPAAGQHTPASAAIPGYDDVEIVSTPRRRAPAAAPASPSSIIVPENDDVELISTPRRSSGAASTVAPPQPAAPAPVRAPAPTVTDEYEVITSKPKAAPAPAQPAATAAPAASGGGAGDWLRPHVERADAEARAAPKVGGVRSVKLALVPHVTFEYDAHVERPALPVPMQGRGAVLVSSLTGELRTVPTLDLGDGDAQDARREAVKLQAVDVYDRVKSHLLKQFSKEVKVEREVGGNTVMENQKISPSLDELGLNHRGIVYVPVWEVTGASGTARVDGLSGTVF